MFKFLCKFYSSCNRFNFPSISTSQENPNNTYIFYLLLSLSLYINHIQLYLLAPSQIKQKGLHFANPKNLLCCGSHRGLESMQKNIPNQDLRSISHILKPTNSIKPIPNSRQRKNKKFMKYNWSSILFFFKMSLLAQDWNSTF